MWPLHLVDGLVLVRSVIARSTISFYKVGNRDFYFEEHSINICGQIAISSTVESNSWHADL